MLALAAVAGSHVDLAADHRVQAGLLGVQVEVNHPEHVAVVGDGHRLHAQR